MGPTRKSRMVKSVKMRYRYNGVGNGGFEVALIEMTEPTIL